VAFYSFSPTVRVCVVTMYVPDAAAGGAPWWGPVTATLDWCESNYAVCEYVAEFWNTVTNAVMIGLALFGAATALRAGAEARFAVSFLGLLVVGIGSWCFHGSLLYEMQLLDELPMLYTTAVFIYCVTLQDPKRRHAPALAAGLGILCAAVTIVYVWLQTPLFHQVSYGSMVLYLTGRCVLLARRHHADHALVRVITTAIVLFLVAWGLWNVDIHWCADLQAARARLGTLGPLLELHGWWHVLTAYSSYLQVVFSCYVTMRACGRPIALAYVGPHGFFPYVVAAPPAAPNLPAKWSVLTKVD
jgi:dihydroceramidase